MTTTLSTLPKDMHDMIIQALPDQQSLLSLSHTSIALRASVKEFGLGLLDLDILKFGPLLDFQGKDFSTHPLVSHFGKVKKISFQSSNISTKQLADLLTRCPLLEELTVEDCPELKKINFPKTVKMSKLLVENCRQIQAIRLPEADIGEMILRNCSRVIVS